MSQTQELIEYLTQIMPAAPVACAGCGVKREVVKAVIRGDQFYCSNECAERSCAILIKAQPKGVTLDGWDI